MLVAGVDAGAATTKTVILPAAGMPYYYAVIPTGHNIELAAEKVTKQVLSKARASMNNLDCVVSTGYGRDRVTFSNRAVSEIICHARGANFLIPETRTVIDIGGQDSKVIQVEDNGRVTDFVMNDKCAAGTGRFLEVMANVLNLKLDELGPISLRSRQPCSITSTCTVFAESEVVSLRAEGKSREDIIAGIHKAIALRIGIMSKSIKIQEKVVFTGGMAKNSGVKKALENELGIEIIVPDEPQIMGALGAALLAGEISSSPKT